MNVAEAIADIDIQAQDPRQTEYHVSQFVRIFTRHTLEDLRESGAFMDIASPGQSEFVSRVMLHSQCILNSPACTEEVSEAIVFFRRIAHRLEYLKYDRPFTFPKKRLAGFFEALTDAQITRLAIIYEVMFDFNRITVPPDFDEYMNGVVSHAVLK
jgi:hypothetical protein